MIVIVVVPVHAPTTGLGDQRGTLLQVAAHRIMDDLPKASLWTVKSHQLQLESSHVCPAVLSHGECQPGKIRKESRRAEPLGRDSSKCRVREGPMSQRFPT